MSAQFPVSDDLGLKPIRRFMSKRVISTTQGTSIAIAIKMMQTHKISGLAVVDSQGKLLGSYSEWDAMIQGSSHALTEPIKYNTPPITVTDDTAFRFVVAQLIKTKAKRLFITDKQNFLIGIVTRSDVLKHIFNDFVDDKEEE